MTAAFQLVTTAEAMVIHADGTTDADDLRNSAETVETQED